MPGPDRASPAGTEGTGRGDSGRFAPSGPSHCLLRPRWRGNLYTTGPSPYPCAGVHKPPALSLPLPALVPCAHLFRNLNRTIPSRPFSTSCPAPTGHLPPPHPEKRPKSRTDSPKIPSHPEKHPFSRTARHPVAQKKRRPRERPSPKLDFSVLFCNHCAGRITIIIPPF